MSEIKQTDDEAKQNILTKQQIQIQDSTQNQEDIYLIVKKREYIQEIQEQNLITLLLKKNKKQKIIIVNQDDSICLNQFDRIKKKLIEQKNKQIGLIFFQKKETLEYNSEEKRLIIICNLNDIKEELLNEQIKFKRTIHLIIDLNQLLKEDQQEQLINLICEIQKQQKIQEKGNKIFSLHIFSKLKKNKLLMEISRHFQSTGTLPYNIIESIEHLKINLVYRQRIQVLPTLIKHYSCNLPTLIYIDNTHDQLSLLQLLTHHQIPSLILPSLSCPLQRTHCVSMLCHSVSKVVILSPSQNLSLAESLLIRPILIIHTTPIKDISIYLQHLHYLQGCSPKVINFYSPASLSTLTYLQGQCNTLFKRIGIPSPPSPPSPLPLNTLLSCQSISKVESKIISKILMQPNSPPAYILLSQLYSLHLHPQPILPSLSFLNGIPHSTSQSISFPSPIPTIKKVKQYCSSLLSIPSKDILKVKLTNNLKSAIIDTSTVNPLLKPVVSCKALKGLLDDNMDHWQEVKESVSSHSSLVKHNQYLVLQAKQSYSQPPTSIAISRLSNNITQTDIQSFLKDKGGDDYQSLLMMSVQGGQQTLVSYQDKQKAIMMIGFSKSKIKGNRVKIKMIK